MADGPVGLADFPGVGDEAIDRCHALIKASRPAARAACNAREEGWLCPAGIAVRLAALEQCQLRGTGNVPAFLYLLGLGYQDVPFLADGRAECRRYYFYQEGSSVCIYDGTHFDRVVARHPGTPWGEMAAFRLAEGEYRYYECEGRASCAAENAMVGFIDYLDQRPKAPYASLATDRVVAALDALSDPGQGNAMSDNDAGGLPKDLDRLSAVARKLAPANRERLTASVAKARKVVQQIEQNRRATSSK